MSSPVTTAPSVDWTARKQAALPAGIVPLHDLIPARAESATVFGTDGRVYCDLTGGLGVLLLGYGHPRVTEAIEHQARSFAHSSFPTLPSAPYIELAERLCAVAGGGRYKTALFNSGAEAIDNAAKICRWATGRPAFLNLEAGFHGRTWASVALTHEEAPFKNGLGDLGITVHSLPLALARGPNFVEQVTPDAVSESEVTEKLAEIERHASSAFDAGSIAGLFIEPVLGNSGAVPLAPAFLEAARRFCNRHGIVYVVDEIQCGLARTGAWFTSTGFGVEADLIVAGKALGGGLPLAAVIGRAGIMDSLHRGALGGTTGGNPVACAAGIALLDVVEQEDLVSRARAIGERSRRVLERLGNLPVPVEVRVIGAMAAVELLQDGEEPSRTAALADAAFTRCRERGVLLLRGGGRRGRFLRILPPLTISDAELQRALETMTATIAEVVHEKETEL